MIKISSRTRAALIHLSISGVVVLIILYLVYGLWYARPFAQALGVSEIFLMILAVDLCLGPLLTAVVYKVGKPSLKFDLSVIVCLQLAAIIYGVYTVAQARPAYLVFSKDRFDLVQAHEVVRLVGTSTQPVLALQSPWAQPWFGPKLTAAAMPATIPENYPLLNLLTSSAMSGGADVQNVLEQHRPYAATLALIQKQGIALAGVQLKASVSASDAALWRTALAKYPANSLALPLKIKYTVYTVIVSPDSGVVLEIVPVNIF